jgi:predicted kinase
MGRPHLIIVSGPAGSGKTTLAHELAQAVGCPALCRDEIKEGMVHATPGFVAAPSDPLTQRTFGLFFQTIELFLRAGVTHVAEAAFQDKLWRPNLLPFLDLAELRILRCHVDEAVARDRALRRMGSVASRRAHADQAYLEAAAPFVPVSMDVPTVDVDTSDGYRPSLAELVTFAGS